MTTAITRWHLGPDNQRDTVVTLPMALRSPQNGSHGHWAARAASKRRQRQEASWRCCGPLAEYRMALDKGYLASVHVLLVRVAPRRLDSDNNVAAFKHVRDGVTDALGLKDDDDPRLTWAYDQEKGATCIRIVVTGKAE